MRAFLTLALSAGLLAATTAAAVANQLPTGGPI